MDGGRSSEPSGDSEAEDAAMLAGLLAKREGSVDVSPQGRSRAGRSEVLSAPCLRRTVLRDPSRAPRVDFRKM